MVKKKLQMIKQPHNSYLYNKYCKKIYSSSDSSDSATQIVQQILKLNEFITVHNCVEEKSSTSRNHKHLNIQRPQKHFWLMNTLQSWYW